MSELIITGGTIVDGTGAAGFVGDVVVRDGVIVEVFDDRGSIEVGKRADLNIIDMDALTLGFPHAADDLPAGGRRLLQEATGYVATVVAGQITRRDGVDTGARPGRLVRAQRAQVERSPV